MTAGQEVVHAAVEVEETTQSKTIDELGKQAADKFVEKNGSRIAPKKTIKKRDWRLGTSKLTGDTVETIYRAMERGLAAKDAAIIALITPQTLRKWRKVGQQHIESEQESMYANLEFAIMHAESISKNQMLGTMFSQALKGNVKAAQFILQYCHKFSKPADDKPKIPEDNIKVGLYWTDTGAFIEFGEAGTVTLRDALTIPLEVRRNIIADPSRRLESDD